MLPRRSAAATHHSLLQFALLSPPAALTTLAEASRWLMLPIITTNFNINQHDKKKQGPRNEGCCPGWQLCSRTSHVAVPPHPALAQDPAL